MASGIRSGSILRALGCMTAAGAFFLGSGMAAQAAGCGTPVEPGYHDVSVDVGGIQRSGVVFVPDSYTGQDKVSVVFDFHGSNSNPRGQMLRSSWDKVAAKNGFLVFAPQGSLSGNMPNTHAWNVPGVTFRDGGLDEVAFIKAAVEKVRQSYCVDPAQIFASGYSGGGRMLSAYLCSGANDFAGAGFVNSLRVGLPVENREGKWGADPSTCQPAKPISIMAFAGVKDEQNPYAGGGKPYWQYSFKTALQRWMELDGCKANAKPDTIEGVTYSLYDTCQNGARIATYEFENGSHDWPKPNAKANVIAAANEGQAAGVVKVSAAKKSSFDPNVDPAYRMWDFFRKADSTDVVATARPSSAKTKVQAVGCAGDEASTMNTEGMTCSNSQPNDQPRRSGLGAKGAL